MAKKIQFKFMCDEDVTKMELTNNGATRHCTNCQRHIADFTKMKPAEIAVHIKNAVKPCGFMYPWQLDQVNNYIEARAPQKTGLLSRVTKVAAIAGSPFIFGNANAQTNQPAYTVEQVIQTGKPLSTEILVKYANGTALSNGKFELYNGENKIGNVTSDVNGKIILEHVRFAHCKTLTIKHESGSTIVIEMGQEAVCINWDIAVLPEIKQPKHCNFHFTSINRSKYFKNAILRATQVEVEFFNANNECIKRVIKRTSASGDIKLKWNDVEKTEHIMLTITTQFGEKSVYYKKAEILTDETNNVKVLYYKKHRKYRRYDKHWGGKF
ncbi:MAG TPA: hypothetical protein VD905_05695 [Flavobacteriales bacterium]|nr:hypothetical protein [Flavobacteriales bacterium]